MPLGQRFRAALSCFLVGSAIPSDSRRFHTTGQRLHRGADLQHFFLSLMPLAPPTGCEGSLSPVLSPALADLLNEQVGHEFAASQQYVAIATHYDAETLPRLRDFFYRQAVEERNHAMMLVQYLLDAGARPVFPATPAPRVEFADLVEPVAVALEQEQRVTAQFNALAGQARQDGDFTSEQFLSWFLKEQVEEVSLMGDLLTIVGRARDNPLLAEEYLAREAPAQEGADPTAPPAAGGAL